MWDWLRRYRLTWFALLWYVAGVVGDHLSSLNIPPGYHEENPYTRDLAGQFVWAHGLAYDGAWLLVLLIFGLLAYRGLRKFSELVAQLTFAFCFFAWGFYRWGAVIHNVWVQLGWYHPSLLF